MSQTAPERRKAPNRPRHHAKVIATERITPHMVRVTFGGGSLADFECGEFTDHYVKFIFCQPGAPDVDLATFDRATTTLPGDQIPVLRTYTVRSWDPARRELAVDFVVHGDTGIAGPWAAKAAPGEEVWFYGPGGKYAPDATADWHLLAGDDAALPAIAAAWERLPGDAVVRAYVEVPGPDDEMALDATPTKRITWIHRGDAPAGAPLVKAVRAMERPDGRVHAFVHGEANAVKDLRKLLRVEWETPKEQLSISGYWRTGDTEDEWQTGKREWNARVEAEEAQALAGGAA